MIMTLRQSLCSGTDRQVWANNTIEPDQTIVESAFSVGNWPLKFLPIIGHER